MKDWRRWLASLAYGSLTMTFKWLQRLFSGFIVLLTLLTAAEAQPLNIVGFGDSLMAGYQLDPGQSFPEKLEAALKRQGHDVVIANAGVSGDTSSGGLSRLDWSIPDGTDLVILELGANDMLRGIAPDVTRKNLTAMIEALQARNIRIIFAGMLAAPNLGAGYAAEFNLIYPQLADTYDLPFYPFFLDGVTAEPEFLLGDGMHPNDKGVDLMVEKFLPLIDKILAEMGAETTTD